MGLVPEVASDETVRCAGKADAGDQLVGVAGASGRAFHGEHRCLFNIIFYAA
jgi:hypothetical protein